MDRIEFEADLRRDGFPHGLRKPEAELKDANHCHDFDARLFILGDEITITRDNNAETFRAGHGGKENFLPYPALFRTWAPYFALAGYVPRNARLAADNGPYHTRYSATDRGRGGSRELHDLEPVALINPNTRRRPEGYVGGKEKLLPSPARAGLGVSMLLL